MKIYTVQRMDKYDYDFSVELQKCGCFVNKEEAKAKAKAVYESMCNEYKEDIQEYSKAKIIYADFTLLETEEDHENGYYRISFGDEDEYECHSVAVDEYELDTEIRDDMLVTAGSRAGYMDSFHAIDLPYGTEGESAVAKFIANKVDEYIESVDESFDCFIERELMKEYKMEE